MTNQKIKAMTEGAMLAGIYGVLGIINLYTGSALDIFLAYVMAMPIILYTYQRSVKEALLVVFVSSIVLFLVGEMFFMVFSCMTLFMGIYYGDTLKKGYKKKHIKIGLIIISVIKNFVIFFIIGSLLGVSVYKEGLEVYTEIIGFIPILKNIINPMISFIIMWVLIIVAESSLIINYGNIFLKRILIKK